MAVEYWSADRRDGDGLWGWFKRHLCERWIAAWDQLHGAGERAWDHGPGGQRDQLLPEQLQHGADFGHGRPCGGGSQPAERSNGSAAERAHRGAVQRADEFGEHGIEPDGGDGGGRRSGRGHSEHQRRPHHDDDYARQSAERQRQLHGERERGGGRERERSAGLHQRLHHRNGFFNRQSQRGERESGQWRDQRSAREFGGGDLQCSGGWEHGEQRDDGGIYWWKLPGAWQLYGERGGSDLHAQPAAAGEHVHGGGRVQHHGCGRERDELLPEHVHHSGGGGYHGSQRGVGDAAGWGGGDRAEQRGGADLLQAVELQ